MSRMILAGTIVAGLVTLTFADDDTVEMIDNLGYCRFEPLVDYDGNDIDGSWLGQKGELYQAGAKADNHEYCARGCLTSPSCSHFSFVDKRCYYKTSDEGRKDGSSKFTISGECVSNPSAFLPTTPGPTTPGTTMSSGDLVTTTADHTACANMGKFSRAWLVGTLLESSDCVFGHILNISNVEFATCTFYTASP
jgi:hypothetical protein